MISISPWFDRFYPYAFGFCGGLVLDDLTYIIQCYFTATRAVLWNVFYTNLPIQQLF